MCPQPLVGQLRVPPHVSGSWLAAAGVQESLAVCVPLQWATGGLLTWQQQGPQGRGGTLKPLGGLSWDWLSVASATRLANKASHWPGQIPGEEKQTPLFNGKELRSLLQSSTWTGRGRTVAMSQAPYTRTDVTHLCVRFPIVRVWPGVSVNPGEVCFIGGAFCPCHGSQGVVVRA